MRPRVIFVVAHDRRGVMGRAGVLPWHLPADLKHFRSLTIDKPVIMGRKTYDSIGKPLLRRRNIVLTRNADYPTSDIEVARTVEQALAMTADAPEIAIIGGAEIFNAFAPYVDTAFVTEIDADVEGDTHYVPPSRAAKREVLGEHPADERNEYGMRFLRYDYANADVTGGSLNESNPSR